MNEHEPEPYPESDAEGEEKEKEEEERVPERQPGTRPESPPTTPPKRPWALCVGDKVECVWPGDSGYQFQITSVHRLAIGFPGGRKVALDPFTIKEMGPRWAQRLAQGIPGSQATTGFTTCARFSRTSSTHGWNIRNNTSVGWQLLGSAQ